MFDDFESHFLRKLRSECSGQHEFACIKENTPKTKTVTKIDLVFYLLVTSRCDPQYFR